MKVFRSSTTVEPSLASGRTAVAIGNFDGVHIGHQALFARTIELARQERIPAVALTFDPHPARYFKPHLAPPLITSERQKLRLMQEVGTRDAGLDAVVIERFDRDFASLSAEAFVRRVLVQRLGARHVVTGRGFVFGRHRSGTRETLVTLGREAGDERGFESHSVDLVRAGGIPISSTKIREFVLMGRMRGAKALLGREFGVAGQVTTGEGRGRTIDVPTANLEPETELLPGRGVYAGRVILPGGRRYPAVINFGTAPTVRKSTRMIIEAHLLDFPPEDLVGQRIRVLFCQRLREEQRFASLDELVAAIQHDIARARELLDAEHVEEEHDDYADNNGGGEG